MAYDLAQNKLAGIFDFGDSAYIRPHDEFAQLILDWPIELVRYISDFYYKYTGTPINIKDAAKQAFYCRICFYVDYLNRETPPHIHDYKDKLREMLGKYHFISNSPSF